MTRIGVLFADGFEEVEGLAVVDICRRAGYQVDTISIMGQKEVCTSHDIHLFADTVIEDADMTSYDMIVVPGGLKGTENIKAHQKACQALVAQSEADKYVAAICAGPTVLGGLGILKGKNACCYGGMEDGLTGAIPNDNDVTVDGKIVTSRGMGTSVKFGLAIMAIFSGQDAADQMAAKIMIK